MTAPRACTCSLCKVTRSESVGRPGVCVLCACHALEAALEVERAHARFCDGYYWGSQAAAQGTKPMYPLADWGRGYLAGIRDQG